MARRILVLTVSVVAETVTDLRNTHYLLSGRYIRLVGPRHRGGQSAGGPECQYRRPLTL